MESRSIQKSSPRRTKVVQIAEASPASARMLMASRIVVFPLLFSPTIRLNAPKIAHLEAAKATVILDMQVLDWHRGTTLLFNLRAA